MGRLIVAGLLLWWLLGMEEVRNLLLLGGVMVVVGLVIWALLPSAPAVEASSTLIARATQPDSAPPPRRLSGSSQGEITSGLVIDDPWIGKILAGEKDWEMRSTSTKKQGRIALIRKGTGHVVGAATLVGSLGPLSDEMVVANEAHHHVPLHMIGKWRHAWILHDVTRFHAPVPYRHRKGAVIWVTVDSDVATAVASADRSAPIPPEVS